MSDIEKIKCFFHGNMILLKLMHRYSLREGIFSRSADDIVEEIEIFSGDQNRIIFQHAYCKIFKVMLIIMHKLMP